jgi:hypothetical protein
MRSWCHGDRPELVATARPGGMEYLRNTGAALGEAARYLRCPVDGRLGKASIRHLLPRSRDAVARGVADGRVPRIRSGE